jgi:formylglycine-generating enzyme required for sulfatase activity
MKLLGTVLCSAVMAAAACGGSNLAGRDALTRSGAGAVPDGSLEVILDTVSDVPDGQRCDAADATADASGADTCQASCAGKECGDDGCGGSCGACAEPFGGKVYECSDGGQCVAYLGPLQACEEHGECASGTCIETGVDKLCVEECVEECPVEGLQCKQVEDSGLGSIWVCIPACQPDCVGKACGNDGCGGTCGACGSQETCHVDQCLPDAGKLTWKEIPGSTFVMGCSPGDEDCQSDEKPQHSVSLPGFDILETEVTEGQYEAVTGSNPSCSYNGATGPTYPVECVTWLQAKGFCEAVGGRLPTEAEWEYAARGGTTTRFYCGDDYACLDEIAWYYSNSGVGSAKHKQPVAEKLPNAYGLYDMLGNVLEWTADWYSETYYSESPGVAPSGPATGSLRVIRGGSWGGTSALRVSLRATADPTVSSVAALGFRCARTP